MKPNIAIDRFHVELAKEVFHEPLTHEEVLCLMLLLHACNMRLTSKAELSCGGTGFEGLTTSLAAEVAASLFTTGDESEPDYWYELWNGEWEAYAILENPPDRLTTTLRRIRHAIESHPWVAELADEDWEILPSRK